MGERDLAAGRRVFDDAAETLLLRTRDPRGRARGPVRPRPPARLPRGRPDPGRGVPARPASSTRWSPTSRRCCSAPGCSAVGDLGITTIADALHLAGHRRDRAGAGRRGRRNVRHHHEPAASSVEPARPREDLMFTGIVEELGTVEALEDQSRRGPADRARAHRARGRRPRRLDRRQRLLPDRRRARRRDVHRRRDARDPRQDRPRRARRPATGSTSSARSPPAPGSAATSSRATSTASGTSYAGSPASTGRSSRSRCRATSRRYLVDKGSITVDGV